MTDSNLQAPTLHRNGTGADDLFRQYQDALRAVRAATDALPNPNARDYYVEGDQAFPRAREEHRARILALDAVWNQLHAILENIADQRDALRPGRGGRRGNLKDSLMPPG